MATFYLLPARGLLGDLVADSLATCLPGIDWTIAARQQLADLLLETLDCRGETFFTFRDEFPLNAGAESALIDGYGAEPGDEVIEIRPGLPSRRWRIGVASAQVAA